MKKEKETEAEAEDIRRARGDKILFFSLAMVLGGAMFFVLYMSSGLSSAKIIEEFFTTNFWSNFGWMILLCFVADYCGKMFAFGIIRFAYKRPTSNFSEFNEMNLGTFLTHLVEVLMRALVFMFGAMRVIQSQLFAEDTFWTLLLTYIVIKVMIFVLARLLVGWIT